MARFWGTTFPVLTHLLLTTTTWGRHYCHPTFQRTKLRPKEVKWGESFSGKGNSRPGDRKGNVELCLYLSQRFKKNVSYLQFFQSLWGQKHFSRPVVCSDSNWKAGQGIECQPVPFTHQKDYFPAITKLLQCAELATHPCFFLSWQESGICCVTWLDNWMLMSDWWDNMETITC